ncbi:uncharacterized protein LOC135371246 [Ornithodoros turicata]|uniref:uncharacterized protein LOC135371246 n=1 Tax=Ornithodoros turicata TaxID=34597 RepID=UPI003138B4F0
MSPPRQSGGLSRTSSFHLTSLGSLWEQDYKERVREYSSTGSVQVLQEPSTSRQLTTSKSCGNISYKTRGSESEISLLPDDFLSRSSNWSVGLQQGHKTSAGPQHPRRGAYSRDSLESAQIKESPRVLSIESVTLDECLLLLNDHSRKVCPITRSACCHSSSDDDLSVARNCEGKMTSRDTQTDTGAAVSAGVPPSTILLEIVNLLKLLVQSPAFRSGRQVQRSVSTNLVADCNVGTEPGADPLDYLKKLILCKKVILDTAKDALSRSDDGQSPGRPCGGTRCCFTNLKRDGRDSGIASFEWNCTGSLPDKEENREQKTRKEKHPRRRLCDCFPADSYLTLP